MSGSTAPHTYLHQHTNSWTSKMSRHFSVYVILTHAMSIHMILRPFLKDAFNDPPVGFSTRWTVPWKSIRSTPVLVLTKNDAKKFLNDDLILRGTKLIQNYLVL